jgi:hypothetical protein
LLTVDTSLIAHVRLVREDELARMHQGQGALGRQVAAVTWDKAQSYIEGGNS